LFWNVKFEKGDNSIVAIGIKNNTIVCNDSLKINYVTDTTFAPEKINLSTTKLPNGNYLIQALVVDKLGNQCLNYSKRIYFNHNGNGILLINQGTTTGSEVIECANGKATIEFIPSKKGKATIEARNQDFKGEYLYLTF